MPNTILNDNTAWYANDGVLIHPGVAAPLARAARHATAASLLQRSVNAARPYAAGRFGQRFRMSTPDLHAGSGRHAQHKANPLRSRAQRPTAFEVRLKTQWESADTTEPQAGC